ncbi:MAG: hypothetical protein AB9873_21000 [Syntrophobacteraceae bacterium]
MSEARASDTKGQEIEIDFFRNEDAPGIARLFQEVYEDGYPIKIYYLPDQLIEENASGRVISCVARAASGEVLGHNALVLMDAATHLYENAAGAVLPTCRGQGVFPRMFKHMIVDAPKRFGVEGIVGEPVCNHTITQKYCLQLGFEESGLEVELMPAAAYGLEGGGSSRVSVLLGYFMLKPRVQTVHMPTAYREQIEYLYVDLSVERTFEVCAPGLPPEGASQGSMNVFDLAQVARIYVDSIGPDFEPFIARQEKDARAKGVAVLQVWLPLASPFTSTATDILRGNGYFLGGVLPCGRNGDSLLMQKLSREPQWEKIALLSERAKRIGDLVKRDWQAVTIES